jgi:N-acetylglucosamine kinase-like BadF-type ATPase
MGWSSGTRLASELIATIDTQVDDFDTKVSIFEEMIESFETMDCDNLHEVLGESLAFAKAYYNLYPDLYEGEEDDLEDF